MRLSMGLIVNILIRLGIIYFLGEVMLLPDDPRFAGKAIPIRNLIIVGTLSLLFPLLHFVKKKWKEYPLWLDNLYLSIFWLDMAGNSLDLYDTYFYFDLLPHMHGTGAIAAVFFGAFGLRAIWAVVTANVIHILLEGQEIFTDIFFGTHNVRGSFDTINDVIAGIIGSLVYVGLMVLWKKNWHRKLLRIFVIVAIALVLLGMVFHTSVAAHSRALLLLSQQFPQVPVKLLHAVTVPPVIETVTFESEDAKREAQLFLPGQRFAPADNKFKKPALIMTFAVVNLDKDIPVITDFANNMSRIGYAVFWVKPPFDAKREEFYENPKTLTAAFRYLEGLDYIDKERISFLGFSVGSSIAFVAASDPAIRNKVHGLVFFGGYYDAQTYYESLATKTQKVNGEEIAWEPQEFPITLAQNLRKKYSDTTFFADVSPHMYNSSYKAKTFILHDKGDTYVPYSESIRLYEALPKEQVKAYHIASLFDHVQPKKSLSVATIGEFIKLYGFVYQALRYL